ncbi:MAG: leucine-rich repeat protein [Prevotella sp.]|nr:leucine-rich repeat protein [Prevotella sp.]
MKKLFTTLIPMMVLLLLGSMPALALTPVEGNVLKHPAKNYQITLGSDGVYTVEAIDPNNTVDFSELPDGPVEADFVNAFKNGTKIAFNGNFTSIGAISNTNKKWEEVNLQDLAGSNTNPEISGTFGSSVKKLVCSDYATSLPNNLSNLSNLTDLTFGAGVETIPGNYMEGNTKIKAISFHTKTVNGQTKGVKVIKEKAFKGCTSLASVTWPSTLEDIANTYQEMAGGAFYGCTSLTSLDLSGTNLVSISGRSSFQNTSLETIAFPETLTLIGPEAFHGVSPVETIDLSGCSNLTTIQYEAFEECSVKKVIFPEGDKLTYIGNDCFNKSGLVEVDMSMCEGITEFGNSQYNQSTYKTFMDCKSLKKITLPPNLKKIPDDSGEGVFHNCTALETVIFTGTPTLENGVLKNGFTIGKHAFYDIASLKEVVFPTNLTQIYQFAFGKTSLSQVLLQNCHYLNLVESHAFEYIDELKEVKVCSHPKTLQGPHGTGAFNNSRNIKIVEVVGCPNTCVDDCVSEAGAFDYDVTDVQTAIENLQAGKGAQLIFPRNLPVCENSPYNSAFDFFVGDYKLGKDGNSAIITQTNLKQFYDVVPNEGNGFAHPVGQEDTFDRTVGGTHYAKNGWLEFINTGDGILIEDGKFLRTYSRTEDSGPVLLPSTITAYRAIDYASTGEDYIQTVRGGYVNINEYEEGEQPDYKVFKNLGKDDQTKYKNYPRYALMTVKGQLLLRPLRPLKVADKNVPQSEWTFVESGNESYVPENTGVVLYSTNIAEDAFLIFSAYTEYDYQFPEYPHTEGRYEEDRLDKHGVVGDRYNENPELRDDINMLQGSYGNECKVAPVLPWNWEKNIFYAGNKQYRNFGFSKGANDGNGGWIRLQPGLLRLNRAYAQIPVRRFNNFNESSDQMPTFTLEDHVTNGSNILVLGSSFEDEEVDGIQTIGTAAQTYEQDAWYTLQGVKVTNPTKGIYIHNNKKVVIK